VAGPGLRKPQERQVVDLNFDEAKFENMLHRRNFAAPLLGVKSVYETQPWAETVEFVDREEEENVTYKKAIELLGRKKTRRFQNKENFPAAVKNTIIVDYDGFKPRNHVKLQGLKNEKIPNEKDNRGSTKIKKYLPPKKFSFSLLALKETLSKIKIPMFKTLFRQSRFAEEPSSIANYKETLEKGKHIPENYRIRGPDFPVVQKHKISLSEFDEIQDIVNNDKNADSLLFSSSYVPPHLIYLQDFN